MYFGHFYSTTQIRRKMYMFKYLYLNYCIKRCFSPIPQIVNKCTHLKFTRADQFVIYKLKVNYIF